MLRILLAVAAVLLVTAVSASGWVFARGLSAPLPAFQSPLGTAFSYQGHLKDENGLPVNETCDFQFGLFDASSVGTQVGADTRIGVMVRNGLFTTPVDFGAGVFDGSERHMEVAVRCPDDTSYTTLWPRTEITAVPYALFASTAASADTLGNISCDFGQAPFWTSSSWSCVHPPEIEFSLSQLDGGDPASISVAIGADGFGLFGYVRDGGDRAFTAHCENVQCTRTTVTELGRIEVGKEWIAVAVGSDGLGLIAYAGVGGLEVAHCDDVACRTITTTTVDSAPDAGRHTAIAIGSDGLGLISYHLDNAFDLKVAHCDDAVCSTATITTLDSVGAVGFSTAVTVGADGRGLIAYHDRTNSNIKVVHCDNVVCSSAAISIVGSTSVLFPDTSIVTGPDGLGLITYRGDDGLKVAHCDDTPCSTASVSTVDGATGNGTSMTLGEDGLGLVSYQDPVNQDLKLAHCEDVTCSTSTTTIVDGRNGVGAWSATAVVKHGLPLIGFSSDSGFWVIHCDHPTRCGQ
ncbi:MAG: hypothetical protein O3A47_01370 [Chloroflexi bacterium]|nr:hypothetical protein [Chloroflexota bacterium]